MALKQAKIPSDILGTPEERKQVDVAFEPERQRLAERQDARMVLGEELSKSQKLQAEEESQQKIAVKEAGVRATGDYISDVEREQRQYREQISANPLPTHKPTQEDLSTYAQLGSLLMTMGLMIGAGGKGNAKAGLDAMTGMLNGWKKGRQDLWQQEARNFEKAFNKVKADRDTIYKNLQEGMKLASTNYAAAKEKFETAAFIAGEGSIVAHRIRTGQLQQALKDMENVDKVWDEFNNKKRAAVSALAQARLQRELADKQRNAMIEAARLRSEKKGGALSAQQQSFEDMVSISLNEAAAQVENLATMKFATTGFWQGRNTKGLLDAPIGVLANSLTSEEVQRYNAVIGIIGREAAKVFAGGRIITDKAAEDFANQFKVREGDKPFTVLEKMANIRQFFERAIEVKQARPDASPGMQDIYINALNSFKNSIPITNKEVNEAKRQADESKGKSKKTFGQVMEEMGKPKKIAAPAAAAPVEQGQSQGGWKIEEVVE